MTRFMFAFMVLGNLAAGAAAQDAVPDLKGTWLGKGKAIVFGKIDAKRELSDPKVEMEEVYL